MGSDRNGDEAPTSTSGPKAGSSGVAGDAAAGLLLGVIIELASTKLGQPENKALTAATSPAEEAQNHAENTAPEQSADASPHQIKTSIWLRICIAALYVGSSVSLALSFAAFLHYPKYAALFPWGFGFLILALPAALLVGRRFKKTGWRKKLSSDQLVGVIGLLLVPAAFVLVPLLEHPNESELDLEVPNLLFNALALVAGGVSLFLAMKDPD